MGAPLGCLRVIGCLEFGLFCWMFVGVDGLCLLDGLVRVVWSDAVTFWLYA